MIKGGNATINVNNLSKAIQFYTEVMGFSLVKRYGDEFATIDAGRGLILGLHPITNSMQGIMPAGKSGSISVGFDVVEKMEEVIAKLEKHGVEFPGGIIADPRTPVRLAFFADPDGNALYLSEYSGRT